MNRLGDALKYYDLGYTPIPVNQQKQPLGRWKELQNRRLGKEEVIKLFKAFPGANVGILTGMLLVLDLDDLSLALPYLDQFDFSGLTVPLANTPSGGQHWCFKNIAGFRNSTKAFPGGDIRGHGGLIVVEPSVNGDGKGWTWKTPLCRPEELLEPPEALVSSLKNALSLYKGVHKEDRLSTSCPQTSTNVHKLFQVGSRDDDLFHTANCLIKGGMAPKIALQVLEILANNCTPPFPEKEAQRKIESALSRAERRERNLTEEVREWVLSTSGHFLSTDVINCLQMSTRQEKKNLSTILKRLCDEGLIEKYGNRAGQFRTVDSICEEIDWQGADTEPLDIRWPFEIERYVHIMPRNIVIVAGAYDAGKTAFLLKTIELNMDSFEIHLFNSEMGESEFKDRLSKFDRPLSSWRLKVWERASNFADVIKPDAVNIIDYLEIHDEFYRVGAYIREIHDKLNKGIAIIALQKNPGVSLGRGGAMSAEKARLYLTMDRGLIRIEKGKNWVHPQINPNKMALKFKLVQGCKFKTIEDWRKE